MSNVVYSFIKKYQNERFFVNISLINPKEKKIVGRKVVPLDVINYPLQYGPKKLGHPVYQ